MVNPAAMYLFSGRTGVRVVLNLRLHGVGTAVRHPHVDREHVQLPVDLLLHFIVRLILLVKKAVHVP